MGTLRSDYASKKRHFMKYRQQHDGEVVQIPLTKSPKVQLLVRTQCCDCGLVHDEVFYLSKGKLYNMAWRNKRATARVRK
jgi:hypothetical protein